MNETGTFTETFTETQLKLKTQISELQAALDSGIPDFPMLLAEIHRNLRQDTELCIILSDEEIGTIVGALEKHVDIQIVAPGKAKSATKEQKAKLAALSADDL